MLRTRISKVWRLITRVARRFWDDHCQTNASALSFATLLALVPLAAVVFSTLSIFPVFERLAAAAEEFVYRNFVPTAGDVIRTHVQQFTQQTGRLTAVGLVFLFISALLLLFTIEETLNKIWRVERGRGLVQRVLAYWAVLTLGPLLMGASLSLTSFFVSTTIMSEQGSLAAARGAFLSVLPFVFEVLAFVMLYVVVPNRKIRFPHALAGGVVAAVLFEGTKRGFTLFLLNFDSYEVIYGALASIPIFFVWIFLSWLVVLIGAEVTATLGEQDDEQAFA
jgi:membrane protein